MMLKYWWRTVRRKYSINMKEKLISKQPNFLTNRRKQK